MLAADVGNRSVRDPFIRYCADGWFHLLSSDSWASTSILHARSRDLVTWEPWQVLPVMRDVPGARNAWAPEYFFDAERQTYLVFWASVTDATDHQRIWYAETADFRTFSPSKLLFDPGHSVIDATMVLFEKTYYLIYKDERGENRHGAENKAMRVATSASATGPFHARNALVSPSLTEGPTVYSVGGRWLMLYDFFLDGKWGASESADLVRWTPLNEIVVPPLARHGTVFSVSEGQYQQLRSAWD